MYAEQDVLLPDVYLPYRSGPGGEATFEAERAYVDHKLENAADVNVILAARGVKPKIAANWRRTRGRPVATTASRRG